MRLANPNPTQLSAKPKKYRNGLVLPSKLASARYSAPTQKRIRRSTPTNSPHQRCITLLGAFSIFQANTSIAPFVDYPRRTLVFRLQKCGKPSPKPCWYGSTTRFCLRRISASALENRQDAYTVGGWGVGMGGGGGGRGGFR